MVEKVAVVMMLAVAACGDDGGGGIGGDDLVCLDGGPSPVVYLLARNATDPMIATDRFGNAILYDRTVETWRPLPNPPPHSDMGNGWSLGSDDNYLNLSQTGFYRSLDGMTWEKIGPGFPTLFGYSFLLGPTSDGSYWFAPQNLTPSLYRLMPGAQAWVGDNRVQVGEAAAGRDGSIWIAATRVGGVTAGLYRISPDGSQLDLVIDCNSPELLLCEQGLRLAVNERGDLYYYNDAFFKIDVGTSTAVRRARLSLPVSDTFPFGGNTATSFAAIGDTLWTTVRTQQSDGTAYLVAFDAGSTSPRISVELPDRNSLVATSSDGKHVYSHTPTVCELK